MSELKIEVGKIYLTSDGAKLMCLDVNNEDALCYNYKHKDTMRYYLTALKPWQEQPKVGWVYEASNSAKWIIVADVRKHNYEGQHPYIAYSNEINKITFVCMGGQLLGFVGMWLKLETGRPADE